MTVTLHAARYCWVKAYTAESIDGRGHIDYRKVDYYFTTHCAPDQWHRLGVTLAGSVFSEVNCAACLQSYTYQQLVIAAELVGGVSVMAGNPIVCIIDIASMTDSEA